MLLPWRPGPSSKSAICQKRLFYKNEVQEKTLALQTAAPQRSVYSISLSFYNLFFELLPLQSLPFTFLRGEAVKKLLHFSFSFRIPKKITDLLITFWGTCCPFRHLNQHVRCLWGRWLSPGHVGDKRAGQSPQAALHPGLATGHWRQGCRRARPHPSRASALALLSPALLTAP